MNSETSRYTPRTIEGLRVAIAGVPPEVPVRLGGDIAFTAASVADLRGLHHLPHRVEVFLPYRFEAGVVIEVNRIDEDAL